MLLELKDINASWLGFQCQQCKTCFIYIQGAVNHQCQIDDNRGVCPDAPKEEEQEDGHE